MTDTSFISKHSIIKEIDLDPQQIQPTNIQIPGWDGHSKINLLLSATKDEAAGEHFDGDTHMISVDSLKPITHVVLTETHEVFDSAGETWWGVVTGKLHINVL